MATINGVRVNFQKTSSGGNFFAKEIAGKSMSFGRVTFENTSTSTAHEIRVLIEAYSNKGVISIPGGGTASLSPKQIKTFNLTNIKIPNDIFNAMRDQEVRSVTIRIRAVVSKQTTTFSTGSVIIDARYSPKIIKFKAIRVKDLNGIAQVDDGEYIRFSGELDYAEDAVLNSLECHIRITQEKEGVNSFIEPFDPTKIENKIFDFVYGSKCEASTDWSFNLEFGIRGDSFEPIAYSEAKVYAAFANMHLSGASTGGVCFGGFSSATEEYPLFECKYPAIFEEGVLFKDPDHSDEVVPTFTCEYPATFSNGINAEGVTSYSLEETFTGGFWIEEKDENGYTFRRPIYRKVLQLEDVAASKSVSAPIGCKIKDVVSLRGYAIRSGSTVRVLPFVTSGGLTGTASLTISGYDTDDPQVTVSVGSTGGINDIVTIIEYTKA